QQIEQKLDPLTKKDVELYLKVMRAAADRVKDPHPEDLAVLKAASKILAESAAGRLPTRDDVMTLERANLVAVSMDQIVAQDMKLDGRTYRGIAEAVAVVIPYPSTPNLSDAGAQPPSEDPPSPLEKRLSEVNAANKKFLAPYRDEIQALMAVVHDPSRLPK
ncbi:MAG: hypothetical protein ACRD4Y_06865, partial [Candidatus Acidiferrales bacterium]